MKMTIAVLLLVAGVQAEAGEFYVETGALFTGNKMWIDDINGYREESGLIGHIAIGYEIREGNFSIDFQGRHESDPTQGGSRDLTNKNAIGVMSRYRF